MNSYLTPAQASAQFISLIVLVAVARWYIIPWLNSHARADALIALLWVHVFRYVALQVFSAQADGFPISDGGATEIVIGDVAGAVIAFTAIVLLRDANPRQKEKHHRKEYNHREGNRICHNLM